MKLLVVGAGEMGRWLADTLAPRVDTVAFADRDAAAAEAAARRQTDVESRAVALETGEAFDIVALAVPMPAIGAAVRSHAPNATGALVDVTGVMQPVLEAMERHAVSEYASFHPLFAPPRAPGRIAYVPGDAGGTVGRIRSALSAAGNQVFETTATDHDTAMESVQTKAHAAVLAYGLAAEPVDERFHTPVSESVAELVKTVTNGEPRVYADVQETFTGAEAVADAAAAVVDAVGDDQTFQELFETAREQVDGVEPHAGDDNTPNTVDDNTPATVSDDTPNTVDDNTPATVGDDTPNTVDDNTPAAVGDDTPNTVDGTTDSTERAADKPASFDTVDSEPDTTEPKQQAGDGGGGEQ